MVLFFQADLITLVYPFGDVPARTLERLFRSRIAMALLIKRKTANQWGCSKYKMQQFITIGSNVDQYKEFGDKSLNHCLINGLFNYCGIENVDLNYLRYSFN